MRVHVEGAKLLSLICGALEDAEIKPLLMWGSLLGQVRDGGIIPHDHDIDLNIFDHDISRLIDFERRLDGLGLTLDKRTPYQMTVTYQGDTRLGIDIWVFYSDGDEYTLYSARKLGGLHHFRMPKVLFHDVRSTTFMGVQVSVPTRAEEVLDLAYGDWRVRRPHFSDDEAPCATVVGAYPVNNHSYPAEKGYSFWGKPLPSWPPYTSVSVGSRAPDARFATVEGKTWNLDSFAGDVVVIGFFASLTYPVSRTILDRIIALRRDVSATPLRLLCVTSDPPEVGGDKLCEPHRRKTHYIHDHDLQLARTFGALPNIDTPDHDQDFLLSIVVIDPARYVLSRFGFSRLNDEWPNVVKSIEAIAKRRADASAPVLFLPQLIDEEVRAGLLYYASTHRRAAELGRLRLDETDLRRKINSRIISVVIPQLTRLLSVNVHWPSDPILQILSPSHTPWRTRRYNDEPSVSHRRFGVLLNLNSGYQGGSDVFPEFSSKEYVVEPGSAMVFPASILHRVEPILFGERVTCVVWLTDDEGIAMNERAIKLIS